MKNFSALAALAAAACFALPASAQCPASGAMTGDDVEPISLVLKYAWRNAELKPTALKTALEKLPTVVRTAFDESVKNQILVKFKGRCEQVIQLESAANAAGVPAYVVNHAHVAIAFKTQPGADLRGAVDAVSKVTGALYSKASGGGLDLHADLSKLSIYDLRSATAPFKCEPIVEKTYEFMRFKVTEGDPLKFTAAADNLKGAIIVRPEPDDVVGIWVCKAVLKADQIEKLEGFKVKKL
jgi:hypothetical protein